MTQGTQIETARGPIGRADLGKVLMHEHVFVLSPEIQQNWPEVWGDEDVRVTDAIANCTNSRPPESTPSSTRPRSGWALHPPHQRIARQGGHQHRRRHRALHLRRSAHFFRQPHTRERTRRHRPDGARCSSRTSPRASPDTGIKAGVIKCATDQPGVTPDDVERVLRACAKAHVRTGSPITTHTHAQSKSGLDQQRIFAEEGVDLTKVVIGHCGDTDDLDYLERCSPRAAIWAWTASASTATSPPTSGWRSSPSCAGAATPSRMVLSHDASCYLDWIPGEVPLGERLPNWHYLHIVRTCCRCLWPRGHRRPDRHHADRQPCPVPCLRRAWRLLTDRPAMVVED